MNQFSQDQLPLDQLAQDHLATRSPFMRSTCHEINSFFYVFYGTRESWSEHQKFDHDSVFLTLLNYIDLNSIPQISMLSQFFYQQIFTCQMMPIGRHHQR